MIETQKLAINILLEKINKVQKVFCEYNEYENLYSPLVFLGNYTILNGASNRQLIDACPELNFSHSEIFEVNFKKFDNYLNNLFILILRLDEYNHKDKTELSSAWRSYIGLDIEFFHIQLRSIMDSIPHIIDATFNAGIPKKKIDSYHRFFNWMENPENSGKINKIELKMLEILKNTKDWFFFQKDIRDALIHHAAGSMVFGSDTQEGILFNLRKSNYKSLMNKEYLEKFSSFLQYNENQVFYFESYAAVMIVELINFLEDFCKFYIEKYNIKNIGSPREAGESIVVTSKWIEKLKNTFT